MISHRMIFLKSDMERRKQDVDVGRQMSAAEESLASLPKKHRVTFAPTAKDGDLNAIIPTVSEDHINNKSFLFVDVLAGRDLIAADFGLVLFYVSFRL